MELYSDAIIPRPRTIFGKKKDEISPIVERKIIEARKGVFKNKGIEHKKTEHSLEYMKRLIKNE